MTPADHQRLRAYGIVVFHDRIVFEARPAITARQRASIEKRMSGPVPPGLMALWQTSFGGTLDYDLRVRFREGVAPFDFREIFYPRSNGCHDLTGWIDHEAELAEEAADDAGVKWSGRIDYLPFGGFEYLARLYVKVAPGRDYGAVFAWMQALPPAWKRIPSEDESVRIADDVAGLFAQLTLARDPFAAGGDDAASGLEMAEAIDALADRDAPLKDALMAVVRAAIEPRA